MGRTMKQWTMNAIGRDHLKLTEVPVPAPGPREILVQVSAVSLNYRDKMVIDGTMPMPLAFPFTPASDMAGKVVAAGAEVTRFKSGDRVISTFSPGWHDGDGPGTARAPGGDVLGGTLPGVLAEYVVLHEDWAVASPASASDAEASTLPCAGLTAWSALIEYGSLHAGQTVVVQGTGGVALLGLQIAAAHGAEVIVTSSDETKLSRALALGARHGINRKTQDWVQAVHQITRDRGADHILEIAGGANLGSSLAAAAVGGHIHVIGLFEGFQVSAPIVPLLLKRIRIHGTSVGHRRALENLVRAVDSARIKPVIGAEHALADLPRALDQLDRGPYGKIVVNVAA